MNELTILNEIMHFNIVYSYRFHKIYHLEYTEEYHTIIYFENHQANVNNSLH